MITETGTERSRPFPSTLTPTEAWQALQEQLSLQMTKSTYNAHFAGARLVEYTPAGGYVISVPTQYTQDWITNRMRPIVTRALQNVTGEPVEISFIVANQPLPAHTSNPPAVENDAYPVGNDAVGNARERSLQNTDIIDFYKHGWTPTSNYAQVFWQCYLNGLNRSAWNVWSTINQFDKRNIFKPLDTYWTPPKRFSTRELASVIGSSPSSVTGRPVACKCATDAIRSGQPLTKCCGKHQHAQFGATVTLGDGTTGPACHYWYTGALEVLCNQFLLLAEIQHGDHPRQHRLKLQVWRLLPILTPAQVDTMPVTVQKDHNQWVNSHAGVTGLSMYQWESITASTLVPQHPGYSNSDLPDAYQPSLSFIKNGFSQRLEINAD